MARKTKLKVEVNEEERQRLESICRKGTSEHRTALRARIILMGARGETLAGTARALGVSEERVAWWRVRWREGGSGSVEERLADEPRPGAPAKFTAEEICAIVGLACEGPEARGRPITHWSQNELADEAVKRGIVKEISQRSVGRFLKSGAVAAASKPVLVDGQARRKIRGKGSRHL